MSADLFLIVILPIIAIVVAVLFGVVLPRMRRHERLRGPIPIAMPDVDGDVIPPRPVRPLAQERGTAAAAPQPPSDIVTPQIQVATGTGTDGYMPIEPRSQSDTPHLRLTTTPSDASSRGEARSSSRKSSRAADGTLQFLPGRLEVVEGRDVGQEIRFVRSPGADGTTVTFGRNDGPQYRHVQLHEPTVSRLHAKMSLEGKLWRLTNMSQTNPVVVNGTAMDGEGASLVLSEGDRVEMGEVVLRFRTK